MHYKESNKRKKENIKELEEQLNFLHDGPKIIPLVTYHKQTALYRFSANSYFYEH